MIIVAKALQHPDKTGTDFEDIDLERLRNILNSQGHMAYAWTFNPQRFARRQLREELNKNGHVWLYLIGDIKWHSTKRLKIEDFWPNFPIGSYGSVCPPDWWSYAPRDHARGYFDNWNNSGQRKFIKIWFLISEILPCDEDFSNSSGYFDRSNPPFYSEYTENSFAFLNETRRK